MSDGDVAAPQALLVVGAGIMGAGIAQVAAQAGWRVKLYDARPGAAASAQAALVQTLAGLAAKGRLSAEAAAAAGARIEPLDTLDAAAGCGVAIEAIVEDLESKRSLFARLESLLGAEALLLSNTSSISITALARGLQHPGRLLGMHFFNPVPLMKLVEVVLGLHSDAALAGRVAALARAWGKTPVLAKSTPGFIVNRIARPYYAEAWALLAEQALAPAALDACLRGAGFRMGPCELMDLIGHDTNLAVTQSVYTANFHDKRYQPSLLQQEMVDGGLLGRKSGRGFYRYPEGAPPLPQPEAAPPVLGATQTLTVHGRGPQAARLAARAQAAFGRMPARRPDDDWQGLTCGDMRLVCTDGRSAGEWAARLGGARLAVIDRLQGDGGAPLAFAVPEPHAEAEALRREAAGWLQALGCQPLPCADSPGLVVARTLAMLINEAADAVLQGVCSAADADAAMRLGVNYPAGPFEWLAGWAATEAEAARELCALLDRLDAHYRGERYRASPWLRRRAAAG
jgi:3-hydroxybutyryl-CoA dehydrogenase